MMGSGASGSMALRLFCLGSVFLGRGVWLIFC